MLIQNSLDAETCVVQLSLDYKSTTFHCLLERSLYTSSFRHSDSQMSASPYSHLLIFFKKSVEYLALEVASRLLENLQSLSRHESYCEWGKSPRSVGIVVISSEAEITKQNETVPVRMSTTCRSCCAESSTHPESAADCSGLSGTYLLLK